MHTVKLFFVAGLSYFGFLSIAVADEPLVAIKEGQTYVACDFTNHAIAAGFYQQLKEPTITGACPEATPPVTHTPVVNTPIIVPK